jgi:ketopantoate reductase
VATLQETHKVLKAHKVRPKSCDGKDFSIEELVAELRRPRALRHASGMNVRNSTWQNLYLKRNRIENEYFHGPIIELGAEYDIPVPNNETALELVRECHRKKLGPGSYRLSDVLKAVEDRTQS